MKAGVKTTEFWISMVVVLGGAFTASGLVPDENPWVKFVALVVSGLTALGYSAGRAFVKAQQ